MNGVVTVILGLTLFSCGGVSSQDSETNLGNQTYQTYCVACHGSDGKLKLNDSPDLTLSNMTIEERIEIVKNGGSMMPAFTEVISEEEIKAVAAYLEELKTAE
jgi:mono/diheme cytochrome c family protein